MFMQPFEGYRGLAWTGGISGQWGWQFGNVKRIWVFVGIFEQLDQKTLELLDLWILDQ